MIKLRSFFTLYKWQICCWILLFLVTPIIIGYVVIHFSFSKIYSTGLFPEGTTTSETISQAPFLQRVTDMWLGGAIGPTGEKVCVTNRNKVYINGIQIALPYKDDPQVGAMQIDVNFSDNTHQMLLYVPANRSACGIFTIKSNATFSSTTLTYRYPENVPLMLSSNPEGGVSGVATMGTDSSESTYEIKSLRFDVIITFIKVIAAWWLLMIAFAESIKIANRVTLKILKK